jgi:hypothetical protein
MTIKQNLIPIGTGVRTGKPLKKCLGLVIHWIGVGQSKAGVIRGNFERGNLGTHYISDWNTGDIIHCVPDGEVCYHVGSANGYTELTRKLVGRDNPNWYFVGIECCIGDKNIPADWYERGKHMELGRPSDKQYAALVEFAADFLTRHGLGTDGLYRHYDITGKLCHVWFCKDEARWEKFRADVAAKMKGEEDMTREETQAMIDAANPKVYTDIAEVPKWAQVLVQRAVDEGIIKGDGGGKLNLTDTDLKALSMVMAAVKGSV